MIVSPGVWGGDNDWCWQRAAHRCPRSQGTWRLGGRRPP